MPLAAALRAWRQDGLIGSGVGVWWRSPGSAGLSVGRAAGFRFLALFAAIFACGQLAIVSSRVYVSDWLVAAPAAYTLAALFPADAVVVDANTINSRAVRLNILPGCEGTELYVLLLAGVIAFPSGLRSRAWGLLLGLSLAFLLNQVRVVVLYVTVRDLPAWFGLVHAHLAPTALVIALGIYFTLWSAWASRTE